MGKLIGLSRLRMVPAVAGLAMAVTACAPSAETTTTRTDTATVTTTAGAGDSIDDRFDLPPEARASIGGGDPRLPAYWAVWNTCAPDNRADVAAANGGRDAGFVLVDDVLADPGIGLGDHVLSSCEESVALLEGRTGSGDATDDPVYMLAAQLLAAELNLTVGAESCPAADEAVLGAHLVLSSSNFDGVSPSPLDVEAGGALPDLIDLLTAYNAGDLCR